MNYTRYLCLSSFSGSPFKFHVDSLASGYVTAYGPGLIYGVCGEPGSFTISTKGAGAGGLSLAVEGPSKADISCHDNKDGTVLVSYLPTAPGEYKITVKFGDKHIKGSPYVAKITGKLQNRVDSTVYLDHQSKAKRLEIATEIYYFVIISRAVSVSLISLVST